MSSRAIAWFLLLVSGSAAAAPADEFAPITAEERSLEQLQQFPGAPAVVLFKRARLRYMDYSKEISSSLEVAVRLKILTAEGASHHRAVIRHSGFYRLKEVAGRTVLPDGRVVPLPEGSIVEERQSRPRQRLTTRLEFPEVQAGAILDYRYSLSWESLFYPEPWIFHEELPVRLSEIVYDKPANLALRPWGVERGAQPVHSESRKTPRGYEIRVWSENLPGIPDEPHRAPFADLASRFMFVPLSVDLRSGLQPLMKSWDWACNLHLERYRVFKRDDGQVRRKARELRPAGATPAAAAAAVHAFVRDEVETSPTLGLALLEKATADRVLAALEGGPLAKALLLQVMLDEIGIESDLVWVYDRTEGWADLSVPNPWWLDSALVRVELGGRTLYLDPVDPGTGFGRLAPYYEGTRGVLVRRESELLDLEASSPTDNLRRARVDLRIDPTGRVAGTGELERRGHRAWRYLRWHPDPARTVDAWQERLAARHPGFAIADVEVREDPLDQAVRVTWSLERLPEEAQGDRVTLDPSRPIGPAAQPFSLPVERRRTPARMPYGFRDELVWALGWAPGWSLESLPEGVDHSGPVGSLEWTIDADPAGRRLTAERRFTLTGTELDDPRLYRAARQLFARAAAADGRELVLARDQPAPER